VTTSVRPAGAASASEGATTMAAAWLVSVGIVADDERAAGGRGVGQRRRDDDGRGLAGLEQVAQPCLREEGDRVAARRLQRGDACDRLRGIAPQLSAQRRNDLTQMN
jgi:hypothetical protein